MPKTIGDKELQLRALKARNADLRADPAKFLEAIGLPKLNKPQLEVLRHMAEKTKEKTVSPKMNMKSKRKAKKTAAKKKRGLHPSIKSISSNDHKTTAIEKTPEQRLADGKKQITASRKARKAKGVPVPALDVAKFMARPEGATMAQLVERFGIKAHPMRAKIHYVRHQMPGWDVPEVGPDKVYRATFKEAK